jgi:endoglucanase
VATYTYEVIALDGAGNRSAASSPTTITVPVPDTQPPSAPGSLTAKAVSSSQVALYWTAGKDDVSVAGYDVYRNGTKVGSTKSLFYEETGLASGKKYTYTVKTTDTSGNDSAASRTASLTMPGASTKGSLAGFAVSSKAGAPLGSTKVAAVLAGTTTAKSTTTNSNGFYLLSNLAPGTYTVMFSATGYAGQATTLTVKANLATVTDVTLTVP